MIDNTNWKPTTGCTKVTPECRFCNAERDWVRLAGNPKTRYFGRQFTDVQCHEDALDQPLRWKRSRKISVSPMSDLFHAEIPDQFIDKVFAIMLLSGQHAYQILTKRVERAHEYLTAPDRKAKVAAAAHALLDAGGDACGGYTLPCDILWPLPNVWLVASVGDQGAVETRVPTLLACPAAGHGVSVEPMIGPVNLRAIRLPGGGLLDALLGIDTVNQCNFVARIKWVRNGCESGTKRRKLDIDWVRNLRADCDATGARLYITQLAQNGKVCPNPVLDGRQRLELPDDSAFEAEAALD